jgi:hypothetical protein
VSYSRATSCQSPPIPSGEPPRTGHRNVLPLGDLFTNDEQRRLAKAYIAQIDDHKVFPKAIVTELTPVGPRRWNLAYFLRVVLVEEWVINS